jgi:hypothetical protein
MMSMSLSVSSKKKMMDHNMSRSAKGGRASEYYKPASPKKNSLESAASLPAITGKGGVGGDGNKGKGIDSSLPVGDDYYFNESHSKGGSNLVHSKKQKKSYKGKGASSMMMRLR